MTICYFAEFNSKQFLACTASFIFHIFILFELKIFDSFERSQLKFCREKKIVFWCPRGRNSNGKKGSIKHLNDIGGCINVV